MRDFLKMASDETMPALMHYSLVNSMQVHYYMKIQEQLPLFVNNRLHRAFLSQRLNANLVALKLQLQNRMCKPGLIFSAISRRNIREVSNMFET